MMLGTRAASRARKELGDASSSQSDARYPGPAGAEACYPNRRQAARHTATTRASRNRNRGYYLRSRFRARNFRDHQGAIHRIHVERVRHSRPASPMYFLLSGAVGQFHLLRYGLAVVLIFVGLKMSWLNPLWGGHFPIALSLAVIGSALAASIALSLLLPRERQAWAK